METEKIEIVYQEIGTKIDGIIPGGMERDLSIC